MVAAIVPAGSGPGQRCPAQSDYKGTAPTEPRMSSRLTKIYDAIDNQNYKQGLKFCDAMLKKAKKPVAKVRAIPSIKKKLIRFRLLLVDMRL